MDWENVLATVIETLMKFVISIVIPYLAYKITEKMKNEHLIKLVGIAEETVKSSVLYINQTYVSALKREGKFDKDAQLQAFKMCKENILALVQRDTIDAIMKTCGDFESWMDTQIESNVIQEKWY